MGDKEEEPPPRRRPSTREQLLRASICKKRYGRATLTIRRWGGFGSLLRDTELGRTIEAFRRAETAPEAVAWAFVRDRVKEHSPTFDWAQVDLDRLVRLVVECSKSPKLEANNAKELADEVIRVQDEERTQLDKLTKNFGRSFDSITRLSRQFANSAMFKWADQNRRTLNALSLGLSRSQAFTVHEVMRTAGLAKSVRRALMPAFQPNIIDIPDYQALFAQQIQLPNTAYEALAKSLVSPASVTAAATLSPTLTKLARSNAFTVSDVLKVAREASAAAEQRGAQQEAAHLNEVAAEVEDVVQEPTIQRLEAAVSKLSEEIGAVSGQLAEAKKARQEDKKDSDQRHRDEITLAVYFFVLSALLAQFMWLLDRLDAT